MNLKLLLPALVCLTTSGWIHGQDYYKIQRNDNLSSIDADFCPVFLNDEGTELIYISNRESFNYDVRFLGVRDYNSDVFHTYRKGAGDWEFPKYWNASINSGSNEDHFCWRKIGKREYLYFTRYEEDDDFNRTYNVYVSRKKGKRWSDPKKLELISNKHDSVKVGHPTLIGRDTLVFASNLAGGNGLTDLWWIKLSDWDQPEGSPTNLGNAINGPQAELYPVVAPNGDLYFAAEREEGIGGLDVYVTKLVKGTWAEPELLPRPLNSEKDDYGIAFRADMESGILASTRGNGRTSTDLFEFEMTGPPVLLFECKVLDSYKNEPVPGATVSVEELATGKIVTKTTDSIGAADFHDEVLAPNQDYSIKVEYTGEYFTSKQSLSTQGVYKNTRYVNEFSLTPSSNRRIEIHGIEYDFDKATLRPKAQSILDSLAKFLRDNPGLVIEIGNHTDCRGSDYYCTNLSQRRAQACARYLMDAGIAEERVVPVGYGEEMPIFICDDIAKMGTREEQEHAHWRNRRTDFKILSWDYVPLDTK